MSAFYFDRITCPYCHNQFSHKDVHFRMETFFEDEEDLNEAGKTLAGHLGNLDALMNASLEEVEEPW